MEKPKTVLLMAIVQSQDVENAENCLQEIGVQANHLPSVGGFLGRKNATLLIPVAEDEMESTLAILQENCRQRIEYIAVPLESAPLPLPTPTPVTIGGATIFGLEIEHYEEF
jgi:uncharacterized protein YaaQ